MDFSKIKVAVSFCLSFLITSIHTHDLVQVCESPFLKINMRYATKDNITMQKIYDCSLCYLHKNAVDKLSMAIDELMEHGYGIMIWDAYQPKNELEKIWSLLPDEKYITNPEAGDSHTRGMSVDVTLFDLSTGVELEMPTEFDCITCQAFNRSVTVSKEAQANRDLLIAVMTKQGFIQNPSDPWWHFELQGWQECPMLEMPLRSISN